MKLNNLKRILQILVFTCLISSPTRADRKELKLGALLHLTGEFASYGVAFREGAELAADEINKGKEIPGVSIKLIFEDTEYKPQQAHSGAKKLAYQDKVSGVLVSTLTEIESAGPIFEKARIPAIVLWDSGEQIDALGDYVFSIGPSAELSGQAVARFSFQTLAARRAVILSSNTNFSLSVSRSFASAFKLAGGTIAQELAFNPDENDFRTALQRLKNSNFDVAYAPVDAQLMAFFKQWKQAKFSQPIISTDVITEDNLKEGGAIFEGVYQSMTADPSFAATQAMLQNFRQYFGRDCQQVLLSSWGYDGVKLLAAAYNKAGSTDGMKDELYKLTDFQGASGPIAFSPAGSAPKAPSIFRVQNSRFESVR